MNETQPVASSTAEIRARGRRFRDVPLRLLIPNLITLLALCLGLTAIRFAFEGSIEWAVSAIAAAAVLDGLDGRIARALKGPSRFGAELDSLADFVDFGVAPALVLYLSGLEKLKALGWMATLVFAIPCSLRLGRFNGVIYDPDLPAWRRTFFVGMPAPAGAIVGLLPVYCGFLVSGGAPASPFLWLEAAPGLAFPVARTGLRPRRRAADGQPRAAFLRQVDRAGAARICGRRSDRSGGGLAVDRQLSAASLDSSVAALFGFHTFQHPSIPAVAARERLTGLLAAGFRR